MAEATRTISPNPLCAKLLSDAQNSSPQSIRVSVVHMSGS